MIYLDNSATTKVLPEVRDYMIKYLTEEYGNPSSKYYDLANNAKTVLDQARKNIGKLFCCEEDEVIFTSGATESNNMILKGVFEQQFGKKDHIIISMIEHSSVLKTAEYLESKGCKVTYLPIDKYGKINVDELISVVTDKTMLVSIMWVNNELGTINDIEEIAQICSKKGVYFHTDATQAVGKIDVKLPRGVNFVSFSGHKIYGPKGIGATIIRKDNDGVRTKIVPIIHGGEQEFDYRAGTQSVHNIAGLSKACEICLKNFEKNINILKEQEYYILRLLEKKLGSKLILNSPLDNKVSGIINFRIVGIKNVVFLKKISEYIAASAGSACSITQPSYILKAIGLSESQIEESIRFSFSPYDQNITDLEQLL